MKKKTAKRAWWGRKKKKWDDRDSPMDKRLYTVEVRFITWQPVSVLLPRQKSERAAADVFLHHNKKAGVRIVPEVNQ